MRLGQGLIAAMVFSIVFGSLANVYYYFFKVPSRLAAVPSIAEMESVWTAFFSGELTIYLYSINPAWGALWIYFLSFVIGIFVILIGEV